MYVPVMAYEGMQVHSVERKLQNIKMMRNKKIQKYQSLIFTVNSAVAS